MTIKKIKSSDILGDNYYTYNLTSSNYTPNLNGSITITCTVKDIYGGVIANKSIQLYQNDIAVGNAKTTNSSGIATWTITCSTAGVQKFSIKDAVIEVFVDTTSKKGHNHTTSDITDFPEIPTKTSDLTDDVGFATNTSLQSSVSGLNGAINNVASGFEAQLGGVSSRLTAVERTKVDTAGAGLEIKQGTKENAGKVIVQHTNNVTALTSPVFQKFSYDSEGHITGKANVQASDIPSLPKSKISDFTHTHTTSEITNFPTLSDVATTGDYNDLDNLPTIPAAYIHPSTHPATMITGLSTVATSGNYNDLSNKPSIPTKTSDLTNDSGYLTSHQDISGKANTADLGEVAFSNDYEDLDNLPTIPSAYTHPSTHPSSMITDSNTHSNIGNTANTLENIITNIDTKLGSLANVDLIEVTSSLGTASANTMNKLYLVAETTGATNDNYEIFVTVRTGTSGSYSYSWEKVDTARIDLSNYLTTANAQQTYVAKESGKGLSSNDYTTTEKNKLAGLHTVATSGSYNDLTNKPSFTQNSNISSSSTESYPIGTLNISGSDVTIYGKDTNTVYEHPTPPTLGGVKTYGLYKTTIDAKGHIINAGNIEASDLPSHTHTISNVTNLQSTLNGKANTSDLGNLAYEDDVDLTTHDVSELTDTNDTTFTPKTHSHGNINNDGTITTVKTIDSNTNIGADYFIIRENSGNATKSANILDVFNKIIEDLIDEGDS